MIELQKKSPRDWITKPLKRVCEISTGMTPSTSNDQYFANGTTLWVKPNDLNEFSPIKNTDQKLTPLGVSVSRKISGGSVLICGIGSIGKFGFSPREVTTNQQIHGISFFKHEIDERFGLYLCSSMSEVFQENSETVVVSILTKGKLERLKVSYPPLQKQQLISRYLDKKTEQIDSLIEKIQKKIELLKEQRTSLINQCVTKGLDPNVEMKDSGVEWIGEIPKHWSLSKIKWVTKKIGSGVTPKGGGDVYSDSGIPFLRSQNIHFDGLHLDDVVFISEEIDGSMSGSRVLKDDVLYNITGGSIGRCCLMDSDVQMNVNQHVCIVRPKESLVPSYLLTILSSKFGQTQLEMNLTGSGREGLNFENLGNFLIPMMNDSEQQRIGEKVTRINTDFFFLETKLKQRIELFKEYRQSLISSVVTGKVRVTEDMI